MPTVADLTNNFDGGPDGVTITTGNSGQYNNDAFDGVGNTGTGTVIQFANVDVNGLNRQTAEYVMKIATGSTTVTPYVAWSTFGSPVDVYMRFYVYFSSIVSNATDLTLAAMWSASSLTKGTSIGLRTSASPFCLQIVNNSTLAVTNMTTTAITAGVWHRIEYHTHFSTTAGTADIGVYIGANADTDTADDSVTQTGQNYAASSNSAIGMGHLVKFQTNTPPFYVSNIQATVNGYLGPAPFRQGKGVPGILTNPVSIHTT